MNRINPFRNTAVAWGKDTRNITNSTLGTINALAFAAVLIACSLAVGCSSDKPKPVKSDTQISMAQPAPALMPSPVPVAQPAPKPAPKKSAPKKPATVNYTDKANGVTFEYPRRYAIETGDAATSIVLTHVVPMNFVAPGGTALAAVELPETGFANTDFSSAFFSVSVHKDLTADQCTEFAVPQTGQAENAKPSEAKGDEAKTTDVKTSEAKPTETKASDVTTSEANQAPASAQNAATVSPSTEVKTETQSTPAQPTDSAKSADSSATAKTEKPADQPPVANTEPAPAPLEFKAMQPNSTEAVSGEGTRQSDSRYFHVYQNGSCYEFALNVTTNANGDGLTKHIDREKVFARLEKILDTVKLEDVKPTPTVATEAPAAAPASSPAQ
jgi:hypothetical protein